MAERIDLDQGDALDVGRVGTKAATLCRLRMAGFDVPEGVVLPAGSGDGPVHAFAQHVASRWDGPVAVRSSAAWEDTTASARAGETTTVLGVEGAQAVADAVRRCLADAVSLPGGADGVAVLVQPMLTPSHAGVAFTVDPVTGERDVVRIGATDGVGDALVGGEVDGIDVVVRSTGIDGDLGGMPAGHALAVAEVSRRIALLLGAPQDVEWAVEDGVVRILQARPITVLPQRPAPPEGGGWQKDVAHYSEPLTPFGWAVLQHATDVVPEVFAEAGLLIDGLEEVLVGGEVYSRVKPAVGSANPGRMPPPPPRVMGVLARLAPPLRARGAAAARLLADGGGDRWLAEWARDRADYVGRADALRAEDLGAVNREQLVSHYAQLIELVRDGSRIHFRVIVPYMLALHDLHRRLAHLEGWTEGHTGSLLTGSSSATTESEADMAVLRQRVAADPAAARALAAAPHDPVGALATATPDLAAALGAWLEVHGWRALNYDAGTPVLAERPSLVTRVLCSTPTRGEPGTAVADVRARLPMDEREGFDRALTRALTCYPAREDTVIAAGDVPLGLARRWLNEASRRLAADGVLGQAAEAAYLEPDELIAALRGASDPERLRAHVVRRRGEEAWARAHPGPLTIGRQAPPPDISSLPNALRRVNEAVLWFVGLEYPDHAAGQVDSAGTAGEVLLRGVAGSPGVAEGPVRIIRDHRDLDHLLDGEVLVCQATSPAWVPLFPLARAVVTDGGGAMSHAAIAAREHGLPAVLATQSGTKDLRDGQVVRVDGTAGTVTAVSR